MAILGKTAKIHLKVVTRKIVSPYHKRKEPRLLHGCKPKLCFPFATSIDVRRHNGNIFNASILEAHYLWEKVHISVILVCTYLWVIGEQKYEQTVLE